jgi:hypothetical protein
MSDTNEMPTPPATAPVRDSETWFERIPEFEVPEDASVTWAGGQVRGPRILPVTF